MSELYARVAGRHWVERLPLPPLAPVNRPLGQMRVALLTSAGVHLRTQRPFDMINPDGDASFRVIPGTAQSSQLTITHDYYDHGAADRDVNCVFPIVRLRELAAEGFISEVAPRHASFMGHILGAEEAALAGRSAIQMAELFRSDGVDAVLASPG